MLLLWFFISVFLSWEMLFHFSVLKLCKSLVTALSFLWVSEEINVLSKLEIIWDSLKRTWICKSNLAFSQARHRKYHRNGLLFDKRTEQVNKKIVFHGLFSLWGSGEFDSWSFTFSSAFLESKVDTSCRVDRLSYS